MSADLRVKLAEAAGWTQCAEPFWKDASGQLWDGLPALTLDWMRELTATLTEGEERDCFIRELQIAILGPMPELDEQEPDWLWGCIHATAEQRARAYLAVKGEGNHDAPKNPA